MSHTFKMKDGKPVLPPLQPNHFVEVDIDIRLRCRGDSDNGTV